jgi:hypothetical protein
MATKYLEQTSESAPYLKEDIDYIADEARRIYDEGGMTPYDQSTIPDMSKERMEGYEGITNIAEGGGFRGAEDYQDLLAKTYRGDFLSPDSNPYVKAVFDNMASNITDQYSKVTAPQLMSRFAQSGRMGSGLMQQQQMDTQEALARQLGQAADQTYFKNYMAERGLMDSALRYAPEAEELAYAAPTRLVDVGLDREAFEREKMLEERDIYERQDQDRLVDLGNYLNLISGDYGGSVKQMTPYDEDEVAKYMAYVMTGLEGLGLAGNLAGRAYDFITGKT